MHLYTAVRFAMYLGAQIQALGSFESKLQKALQHVKVVLDATKAPCLPADVHHKYEDKYALAESMTNAAGASQLNCLSALGVSGDHVAQMREWAKTHAVSLKFKAEERCTFDREETNDVESKTKTVNELSVGGDVAMTSTSKVVTTVTEYFWNKDASYQVTAVRGVGQDAADQILILTHEGRDVKKTTTKTFPSVTANTAFDVNISWLLRQLPGTGQSADRSSTSPVFKIDRSNVKCHTPHRNPDIKAAQDHFAAFSQWSQKVGSYTGPLFADGVPGQAQQIFDAANTVFVPVLPLLEQRAEGAGTPPSDVGASSTMLACITADAAHPEAATLDLADLNRLLADEARALNEKIQNTLTTVPAEAIFATAAVARLMIVLKHCQDVCGQWLEAVQYIEDMLRTQLIAAIGKEVSPADFAEYTQFHNRKLFNKAYAPSPFCFAVRRSDKHSPEGTVSIEQDVVGPGGDGNMSCPIVTLFASSREPGQMDFPLSASTSVTFGGERYLHAWVSHQFSGASGTKLKLVSRARQFSSMLVLVGRIASATTFDPKYAAIVQNKDELTIPLELSTIPTPKEFKDAIESLSPEQQAFAKAFRAMQLESTLFGVLVIQIKPQLEKVLNLPQDSLTKEIKLTQELMNLFIKYQIPSDLLSFDETGAADGVELVGATRTEKLNIVKGHVQSMNEMITLSKEEEVAERRMVASWDRTEQLEAAYAGGGGGGGGGFPGGSINLAMSAAPMGAFGGAKRSCGGRSALGMVAAEAESMPRGKGGPPPPGKGGAPRSRAAAPGAPPPPASAASAPAPAAQTSSPAQPQQTSAPQDQDCGGVAVGGARDFTRVPAEMDESFEKLDTDGALRPTIIKAGERWTKQAQKALLASPTTSTLHSSEQKKEKDAAFDLLDALTKSGALTVDHASLHIVLAATHCFDKSVTETVVQDNVNPIEKVERSTLIMASTIHQQPPAALINESQRPRVQGSSPMLFLADA